MQQTTAKKPLNPLNGSVRAPGDKSMSHRAVIFGALAEGVTHIRGLLEGDDILRTIDAMRAFGAKVDQISEGEWTVEGCGAKGWQSPKGKVDFGNAGTGARLIMGAAAGFDLQASYKGDKSLSMRPMGRVLIPLSEMGAFFESKANTLPIRQTQGGNLTALSHSPEHASAQVKSALLLAGLGANGTTDVTESRITRDHTENMLEAFGVPVSRKNAGNGQKVSITGPARLKATKVNIPGDPSSAAFLIAAALVVPGSDIVVENVMMNPSRTGLFEVLIEMGAFLRADNFRRSGGETIADIHVKHSKLGGVSVPAARVPSMVDEYPVLAVVAAFARGTTEMRGLGELRVKESDRLTGTYDLLRLNGVSCDMKEDMLSVEGGAAPLGGGRVATHHDHRLAMSALVLGLGAQNPVSIDDATMIKTSFPSFFDLMDQIGAPIDKA